MPKINTYVHAVKLCMFFVLIYLQVYACSVHVHRCVNKYARYCFRYVCMSPHLCVCNTYFNLPGESVFQIVYGNFNGRSESITHDIPLNSSTEALYFRYIH